MVPRDVVHGYRVVDGVGFLETDEFAWNGNWDNLNPRRVAILHHFKGSWKS
jgi:hypothetical protein